LKQDTTMYNLDTIIKGWSTSDKFNEPWMDRLRDVHKKQ